MKIVHLILLFLREEGGGGIRALLIIYSFKSQFGAK